jgi:hypothetical protein
MDIRCPKCGEPWDSYGITHAKGEGDLTLTELRRFLRGEGCPSCHFGTICTRCDGAGIENNACPTCFGKGYIFPRRAPQASVAKFRTWFIGYANNVCFPLRNLESIEIIHEVDVNQSADGPVLTVKAKCPDCKCQADPCTQCGGDGKFHQDMEGDHLDGAVTDLLDASDEEPISVLARFVRGTI